MEIDLRPLEVSLRTAPAAAVLAAAGGIAAAWWRVRSRGRWLGFVDGLLLVPVILPPTVVGLALLLVFGRASPVGAVLGELGVRVVFSWYGAVIAGAVVAFPLVYHAVRGAFAQVERALIESARLDGASEVRVLWSVLLPASWPGVAAGVLLGAARALGEFGATLLVAGSLPGRTQTLPLALFSAVEARETDVAIVYGLLLLAGAVATAWILDRLGRRVA